MNDQIYTELLAALTAESVSAQRYAYFAQIADIEGDVEAAELFRQLAESVACAAGGHLDLLRSLAGPRLGHAIGSSQQNMAASLAEGVSEASDFYPRIAQVALDQGFPDIASWMMTLSSLKKNHVAQLQGQLAK